MFSESSSPYNSLEYLKYGGRTTLPSVGVHGIRRALRHLKGVRTRSSPRRGASLGPWEGVFGGRARRRRPRKRATRKQLLALAKGRAKLAKMRRHGRKVGRRTRRGGKAGKRKFLADLNDFYRPRKVRVSQETADNAALKAKKLLYKLRMDYGLGTNEFTILPEVYHLTRVLNKCFKTLNRCRLAGYDPTYGWPDITDEEAGALDPIQDMNLEAKARRGGDKMSIKNIVRKMWMEAHPGQAVNMAEVNRLVRQAKTGAYRDLMDAEMTNPRMNQFKAV